MRQTNFKVGQLRGGYDSCYSTSFTPKRDSEVKFLSKNDINELEKSHWDHSRSWSLNFQTEKTQKFNEKKDVKSFSQNKFFGYQNTLN